MPNPQGFPRQGEEVQFADGTTCTIKRYVRSRTVDVAGAQGHICEMANPCRSEYVTVVSYEKTGFWAAWEPVTAQEALSPDQRYEAHVEAQVDAATRDRLVNGSWDLPWYGRHPTLAKYLVATGLYLVGVITGAFLCTLAQ